MAPTNKIYLHIKNPEPSNVDTCSELEIIFSVKTGRYSKVMSTGSNMLPWKSDHERFVFSVDLI